MAKGKHLKPRRPKQDGYSQFIGSEVQHTQIGAVVERGADISLIIRNRVSGGFEATALWDRIVTTYPIKLDSSGLIEQYDRMVSLLEDYIRNGTSASLQELAFIGNQAFIRLIKSAPARDKIVDCARSGSVLRVDINAADFQFPWNLLYLDRFAGGEVDPQMFLGFAHEVSRIPYLDEGSFLESRPSSMGVCVPRIIAGVDSNLSHAVKFELPCLRRLQRRRCVMFDATLAQIPNLDPGTNHVAEHTRFREFLENAQPNIIHLACHANTDVNPSTFTIDKNFTVKSDIFADQGFRLSGQPVVFLNACEMGMNYGNSFRTFLNAFFDMGAKAVLAPECRVVDNKATYFSRVFYKHFVRQHDPIATATYWARQNRLNQGDYTGLAYTLFGQPEARLDNELARGSASSSVTSSNPDLDHAPQ